MVGRGGLQRYAMQPCGHMWLFELWRLLCLHPSTLPLQLWALLQKWNCDGQLQLVLLSGSRTTRAPFTVVL